MLSMDVDVNFDVILNKLRHIEEPKILLYKLFDVKIDSKGRLTSYNSSIPLKTLSLSDWIRLKENNGDIGFLLDEMKENTTPSPSD